MADVRSQGLWFRAGKSSLRAPLVKRFKARATTFFKKQNNGSCIEPAGFSDAAGCRDKRPAQASVPNSNRAAQAQPKRISAEDLKAEMFKPNSDVADVSVERPSSVVDLHIDALLPNGTGGRTPGDLLKLQLDTFEKMLESAIANGMSDITFIHGVGSGALRTELHKRLGQHPNVKFFEDAQKQKFGYGATKVTIK